MTKISELNAARESLLRELGRGASEKNAEYLIQRLERLIDAKINDRVPNTRAGSEQAKP